MRESWRSRNIIQAILVGCSLVAVIAIFSLLLLPNSTFTVHGQANTTGEAFPGGQPFEWVLASRVQSESELELKFYSDRVRPPFKRVEHFWISRPAYVCKNSEGQCTSRLVPVADSEFELTIVVPLAELHGIDELDVNFTTGCDALKYYALPGNPVFSTGEWTQTIKVKVYPQ